MTEKLFLTLGGMIVTGGLAYHLWTAMPPSQALVGVDTSPSVERKCAGVINATRAMLKDKPGIQQGSMLGMLVMGRDARNPQPTLGSNEQIPIPSNRVYGQDPKAFLEIEKAFFAKYETACQSAPAGTGSPIYELVRQGLAHLHGEGFGCGPKGRCYFLVKTDLDEDVESALRAALERGIKDPSVQLSPELAGSLDNSGIEVHFCGTSEVHARRGASASSETRIGIWTQLFTDPKLVSFQPFCE